MILEVRKASVFELQQIGRKPTFRHHELWNKNKVLSFQVSARCFEKDENIFWVKKWIYRFICNMDKNNFEKLKVVIIAFLVFINISNVFSQYDDLILVKDSDGIQVFKAKDAHENINRIVARTFVESDYMIVLCLIKDFENQKNWIYANHGAFCIDSISPTKWIYYGISETPWPILDRDAVADVNLEISFEDQSIVIHSVANPDLIPTSPDMVRIQMLDSKWRLKKLENGTKVELDLLVDVGGNVPTWLVNMFAAKGPFNTFKNMKIELQHPERIRKCGYQDFFE